MKEPVIIQFDGDESYLTVIELVCYNMNLNVAAKASTVAGARQIVADIEAKKLVPDIAIISSYIQRNFKDGFYLAKKLREICPEIKIIAYTEVADEDWADEVAIKSQKDPGRTMIAALEKLTGAQFNRSADPHANAS